MNRGVLQSSPVQQMMGGAGNPNWWNININNMRPPISAHHHHHHINQHPPNPNFLAPPNFNNNNNNLYPPVVPNNYGANNSTSNSSMNPSWHDNQDQLPESWSQLLLGGLVGGDHEEHEKGMNMMSHFHVKKLENWEDQQMALCSQAPNSSIVDVKQEQSSAAANNYVYGHRNCEEFQAAHAAKSGTIAVGNWGSQSQVPHQIMASSSSSSPKSCVTSFSSNMLDFSSKAEHQAARHSSAPPDRTSECNSTATGGALKKARVNQASSTPTTFKVRKEKLGDRITALHQLVSPFGKTDTASVLLEAIGYIRFLQSQIEALSLPYLGSGSGNMRQQQSVHGERNCMFPEDPGQLLNDNCMKRKGAPDLQDFIEEAKKDLRSRGLCLVPVSCTLQVGSDNGADYWAPAALGGGFR